MAINLGNISGNRIIGLGSGIDSEAIVKDLSAIRGKPIDSLNTKIDLNKSKVSTFSELSTLLSSLKTSLNYLRKPAGINSQISNIFEYRTTTLGSSTLTPSSYLSVTANPGSLIGTSKVQIGQLATALEQRSAAFNARNVDATTASTGSYFTAGTFQIGSGVVTAQTGTSLSGYQTVDGDYSAEGLGTGVLTAAGMHNFNVIGASGGKASLKGAATSVAASNISGGTAVLSITIGGVVYSTGAIQVDDVIGGNTGIEDGRTITFTNDAGGVNEVSFDIITASDIIIDDTQANLDDFAEDLADAISDQVVYQARQITNYTDANVKSPLTGLTSTDVKFYSDSYGTTTGAIGDISGFIVEYGAGNTSAISVDINGETFRATGLGNSLNTTLVLSSNSTDKELRLDLTGVAAALANDDNAVSLERALDYAFGTRTLTDITVSSGESLNDVIYGINTKSAVTGASASIMKISDFDYRFDIKANNEGIDNQYEIFDSSNVLANTDILEPANIVQEAQDSLITIDGIEISRSSNTISDAISNVTLTLAAVTPNYGDDTDTVDIQVDNDISTISAGIKGFLDAYNAVRLFYSTQSQRDTETGEYTEDSILGGDTTLQSLVNLLGSEVNAIVSNASSSSFNSLSDIGVKLENFAGDSENPATTNILTYDITALEEKLRENFDKFREIFEFKFTSSSTSISVSKTSNSISLSSFKLDIDSTRPVGEQVKLLNADGSDYLDSDNENVYLTALGQKITGQTGTPLEGLEFIYTGDGEEIISFTLSQGIADKLYNVVDSYTAEDGLIDRAISSLDETNTAYRTQIEQLQVRLDAYTKSLQDKFSALEAAIASVNNILQLLDANDAVSNRAS